MSRGRSLESTGNSRSRQMTIRYRTRLIDLLVYIMENISLKAGVFLFLDLFCDDQIYFLESHLFFQLEKKSVEYKTSEKIK